MNLFTRLKIGLSKTRTQIGSILGKEVVFDDAFYTCLEEALVSADIGLDLSLSILDKLRKAIPANKVTDAQGAYTLLKKILAEELTFIAPPSPPREKPWVVLVVGVNGVGKTTTIGKIAQQYREQGKKIIIGAADTFRAGAIEQLRIWAERTDSDFVSQHEGADSASVAFDTLEAAKNRNADIVLLDTAGRLHNKVNLMNELEKIVRVMKRNTPSVPHEVLLVVDATTGQNALKQVEVFHSALGLTGLVITKLDGTAKGGIAIALTKKFQIPIRKIGVGESVSDLQDFDPVSYVEAMFGDLGK
jgi:fused signal recognition particle receptor